MTTLKALEKKSEDKLTNNYEKNIHGNPSVIV
jgi:hypothetical protein